MELKIPEGKNSIKSNTYKHVYKTRKSSTGATFIWQGKIGKQGKCFAEERQAAKWVDIQLIRKGKEPVNVMVRK